MADKTGDEDHHVGLGYYDKKPNEPKSSVMGGLDYDFSILRYPEDSPLKVFVEAYIVAVNNKLGIDIFNCRFERPQSNSNFLNFYIYLRGIEPDALGIHHRIDDCNHALVKAFYEVLETNELPAIDTDTRLQFLVKNFENNSRDRAINFAWRDIHIEIRTIFPEVASLSNWNVFYVFIKDNVFEKTIANMEQLKKIKEYCRRATKKHDIDNVWNNDNFYIRIDNSKYYEEIGGQHYFNSDSMFECMTL